MQRYDANGLPVGVETRVNTTIAEGQTRPVVAELTDGNYVVAWEGNQSGDGGDIYFRRFDANGNALGNEERANTTTHGIQEPASIAALRDGGFVVAWQSFSGPYDISAQVYDSSGLKVGSELGVNTTLSNRETDPYVTALTDGGFLITWSSAHDLFGDIYSQRYDANGHRVLEIRGTSADDVIVGGEGQQFIEGLGGDDDLYGTAGDDKLFGGTGNDTMIGGLGDDTYDVDTIGDVVIEAIDEGSDLVRASVAYVLSEDLEDLTLTGEDNIAGTGNTLGNAITGNIGNNTLSGVEGNDTLDGRAGVDTLIGGTGDDTYVVDTAADIVTELLDEGNDLVRSWSSYVLPENVESLVLIGVANVAGTGNAAANVLTGNIGHNQLDGGGGADTLKGGKGNDIYIVDTIDIVVENVNEGVDTIHASFSYTLGTATNVENLLLLGVSNLNGTGNALDNVLTGNSGNNVLTGLAGNDTLDGGLGADTMVGGTGNDTYLVDTAADVVVELANEGRDLIRTGLTYALGANIEDLTLTGAENVNGTGNALDNVLTGNAGNNVLNADGGNDTLDGGAGADTLIGGSGNDVYVVDDFGDIVVETPNKGTDSVQSSIGFYTLPTNVENLTLIGNESGAGIGNGADNVITGNAINNELDGGSGNDRLVGGGGDDNLFGGLGGDTMLGGTGNDRYSVDSIGDVVTEEQDQGIDTVQSTISYLLGAHVEHLNLDGTTNLNGTGNALSNGINGNVGKNVIDGKGGSDWLWGGAGNDTLVWDELDFWADGSAGTDVLRLDGSGKLLDLTVIANSVLRDIEVVDITGSGNDTLRLDNSDVQDISSTTDTLKIEGNAGDIVQIVGAGWTNQGISGGYYAYTMGALTLMVDRDILVA